MTDLTPAKIRAIRRATDPRMHIWGDIVIDGSWRVYWLVFACLAVFGVIRPLSPGVPLLLASFLVFDWLSGLRRKIRAERERVRKARAIWDKASQLEEQQQ